MKPLLIKTKPVALSPDWAGKYFLLHSKSRPNGNVYELTDPSALEFQSGSGGTRRLTEEGQTTVTGPFDSAFKATRFRKQEEGVVR